MKDQWIACKDRLPERDDIYLVVHSKEEYIAIAAFDTTDNAWFILSEHITHWMELPKRPSGN